jgi:hypothetical protein
VEVKEAVMKAAKQIAIRNNSKDLFDFLIYLNIDLTRLLNRITYLLHLAVCDDRMDMVEKLVRKVDVNVHSRKY